ncbi:hypothetical protein [Paraburkholderia flagellata]|uniref:hypothetical protein n=1 Tax=Paraburkholderia flagellata TaxID=2883241 RepID=UPI001F38DFA6|nr:hypothetical protein [Paraburkholderia flagellata]
MDPTIPGNLQRLGDKPAPRDAKEEKRRKYRICFALSILFSVLTLIMSAPDVIELWRESHLPDELLAGLQRSFASGVGAAALAQAHSVPAFARAMIQMLAVVSIALMWFATFALEDDSASAGEDDTKKGVTKGPRLWLVSLIPVVVYTVGMMSAYQPAVFVMALAAIFVAAEHYGKLSSQKVRLTELIQQSDRQVNDLTRIANSTQLKLSTEGVAVFIQDVYRAYFRSSVIYGVVRSHTIDDEWLIPAMSSPRAAWDDYLNFKSPKGADGLPARFTMASSLMASPRSRAGRRTLMAHFVSDMPLPMRFHTETETETGTETETETGTGTGTETETELSEEVVNSQKARQRYFTNLLGLAWECVVFDEVRRNLSPDSEIGSWISKPFCWAHATDQEVWQVIEWEDFQQSIVVKVADASDSTQNVLARLMSEKIIDSTQSEIRRYVRRGGTSEEYLCAMLCYAACAKNNAHANLILSDDGARDPKVDKDTLASILGVLDWESYIGKSSDSQYEARRALCLNIFERFILICHGTPLCSDCFKKRTEAISLAYRLL